MDLRIALLVLGALFVAGIFVDNVRRRYRRAHRIEPTIGEPDFLSEATTEENFVEPNTPTSNFQPSFESNASDFADETTSAFAATSTTESTTQATQPARTDGPILVVYLEAESERPYVGYELLQALLTAGLRYGDMNIFHRFEELTGKGRRLFSLANAAEPGTFDIQKMGTTTCKALTLFIQLQGDNQDILALDRMMETANQLSSDLGGRLLTAAQEPLTAHTYQDYRRQIDAFSEGTLEGSELLC